MNRLTEKKENSGIKIQIRFTPEKKEGFVPVFFSVLGFSCIESKVCIPHTLTSSFNLSSRYDFCRFLCHFVSLSRGYFFVQVLFFVALNLLQNFFEENTTLIQFLPLSCKNVFSVCGKQRKLCGWLCLLIWMNQRATSRFLCPSIEFASFLFIFWWRQQLFWFWWERESSVRHFNTFLIHWLFCNSLSDTISGKVTRWCWVNNIKEKKVPQREWHPVSGLETAVLTQVNSGLNSFQRNRKVRWAWKSSWKRRCRFSCNRKSCWIKGKVYVFL